MSTSNSTLSPEGRSRLGPVGHPDFDGHESVTFVNDEAVGLRGIIAIHRYGAPFSAGGIRMQPYDDNHSALGDVLRLSRAMTYKIAMTGLPARGAKSVILGDPHKDKSPELLAAFAKAVNRLGGSYHCGGDVGISSTDMDVIRQHTTFTPPADMGDLAVPTAQGVFHAIRSVSRSALGRSTLDGVHVAVQGVGEVGRRLCSMLNAAGARLTVADVNRTSAVSVAESTGARIVAPAEVLAVPADIVSPCALGGVLNTSSAGEIRARVVCGAANNQLESPEIADLLAARGITYVPDFVANAGGVLGGLRAACGYSEAEMEARIEGIGETVAGVLELAQAEGLSTHAAAETRARQIMSVG